MCEEYDIDKNDVLRLSTLNPKILNELPKDDWIRRSEYGDFLFEKWSTGQECLFQKNQKCETGIDWLTIADNNLSLLIY